MVAKGSEVFGGEENFWLYSKDTGYDLTHPETPSSPPVYPRVRLTTTTEDATIDPTKTALVIIDLQNYFLSPALGRSPDSVGMKIVEKLLDPIIPSCRKVNIPIVWMNWGLTDDDLKSFPPTIAKGFTQDTGFPGGKRGFLPGEEIGKVKLQNGSELDAGRLLIRGEWNARSWPALADCRQSQDEWIDKNRLSGFWEGTDAEERLKKRGIKTLLFAGANVDQCVACSLQDAFNQNFDCLLLSDATGTSSPDFARQNVEYQTAAGWGFVLSSDDLKNGIDQIQDGPG